MKLRQCVREIARNWTLIQSLLTLKASRYLSSSSRRSLFGAVSTESSPSNFIVNLPALKASVADGGRVMLGIVRGLRKMKKNKIYCYFLIPKSVFSNCAWTLIQSWANKIMETPCAAKKCPSVNVFFWTQSAHGAFIYLLKNPSFKYVIYWNSFINNVRCLMFNCSH